MKFSKEQFAKQEKKLREKGNSLREQIKKLQHQLHNVEYEYDELWNNQPSDGYLQCVQYVQSNK